MSSLIMACVVFGVNLCCLHVKLPHTVSGDRSKQELIHQSEIEGGKAMKYDDETLLAECRDMKKQTSRERP